MTEYRETSTWERMTRGSMQRCDGKDCGHGLQPGSRMWVTRRIATNPTEGQRSHCIVLCEDCRIRQVAQDWAAACEVPEFVVRGGTATDRGIAGGVYLDARQYKRAADQATRLIDLATAPESEPTADARPVAVPAEDEAIRREQKRSARRVAA